MKYRCLCYTAASAEQVSAAVMAGQRPDLVEIKGPEDFEVFARTCVEKCWNDKPEEKPTFDGEIFACVQKSGCAFLHKIFLCKTKQECMLGPDILNTVVVVAAAEVAAPRRGRQPP